MHKASRDVVAGLLLMGAAMLGACSNGEGGAGLLGGGTQTPAAQTSKKFWDRCIQTECPPMNEDDGRPKKQQ
jgi:hypothetical protein